MKNRVQSKSKHQKYLLPFVSCNETQSVWIKLALAIKTATKLWRISTLHRGRGKGRAYYPEAPASGVCLHQNAETKHMGNCPHSSHRPLHRNFSVQPCWKSCISPTAIFFKQVCFCCHCPLSLVDWFKRGSQSQAKPIKCSLLVFGLLNKGIQKLLASLM